MPADVLYSDLEERDIDELASALHTDAVYQYIGGVPSRPEFERWLRHAIVGPPSEATGERWLNFTVRLAESKEVIGRLEANIHDQLAEVAFLYSPRFWGLGYASEGLVWLQRRLSSYTEVRSLWATTHPENQLSASLLRRHGYLPVAVQGLPVLYSYEAGDHVFTRGVA